MTFSLDDPDLFEKVRRSLDPMCLEWSWATRWRWDWWDCVGELIDGDLRLMRHGMTWKYAERVARA